VPKMRIFWKKAVFLNNIFLQVKNLIIAIGLDVDGDLLDLMN